MSEGEAASAVAIVGLAGRFPGAPDLAAYWRNLRDGVESITFFSEHELAAAGVPPALLADPAYVRARGVLEGVDLFDAPFFEINPREAEILNPQHRLFLETAWEAMEDAGYAPGVPPGLVAVFAGSGTSTYFLNVYANRAVRESVTNAQVEIGNEKDHFATQASYRLNLHGPSLTLQTGCSTSLVAVHMAAQSLLAYECDLALAGGVSITLPQIAGDLHKEGGVLSPDGHCRAFDARARGTVNGSGVGVVLLKRLEEALADGDSIRAVLRGSAVNNDGARKIGYTAPSVPGQAAAVEQALAMARLEARDVSYVEAHGTGTALGDPIEIAALNKAFRRSAGEPGSCALGSVKSNIGHLNAAAGVAGLIKTVLMLAHRQLVPSLHFERPNPEIDFAGGPFRVNTELRDWPSPPGVPRRAGVSSFSIGGTNAHVVIEEAPPPAPTAPARPCHLLLLSAKTAGALERATDRLAAELARRPDSDIADVAFTLHAGRRAFGHRRMLVARSAGEAARALAERAPGAVLASVRTGGGHRPVAWLFPGQGAQHSGMGAALYASEPTFRREVDRCAEILAPDLGDDLRRWLYPVPAEAAESAARLGETAWAQPALFVHEYALARQWEAWGARPEVMLGHSLGEYVAACLAGVFTLEDALAVVALRGKLGQEAPPGGMLAVALPEEEATAVLGQDLALAAVNGPAACVVSGPLPALDRLAARLEETGVACRRLATTRAFHSAMMAAAVEPLTRRIASLRLSPPRMRWISNLTGRPIADREALDPAYWGRHLRETVRFAAGLEELLSDPDRVLLEVGPSDGLCRLARRHPSCGPDRTVVASASRPGAGPGDDAALLGAAGRLWLAGIDLDPRALHPGRRRRLPLPTYPFERRRFWVEPERTEAPAGTAALPAARTDPAAGFFLPAWRRTLPPEPAAGEPQRWLVLTAPGGLAARLVGRLRERGEPVVLVEEGPGFLRRDDGSFAVRAAHREDWAALFWALRAEDLAPSRLLHLWCAAPEMEGTSGNVAGGNGKGGNGAGSAERWLELAFHALTALVQAASEHGPGAPLRLAVVSHGVQQVAGERTLQPEKATLLGPCRVIPREYPHLACQSFDVDLPVPGSAQEGRLADLLLAELAAPPADPVVAYRGLGRWVPDYEPVRLVDRDGPPRRLREEGTYLIAGGLGGIGLAVARELARRVRARLVLIGRGPLPKPSRIAEIEALGAEVMAEAGVDIADAEKMAELVERVRRSYGEIHGVVHAEEPPRTGGLIQFKSPAAAAEVLAAKVRGTRVLDALTGGPARDFLVLFSSTFALTGGLGLADYCAADSFLDAFARREGPRREELLLSLDWSVWRDDGGGAAPEARPHLRRVREESGLTFEEGAALFVRALASPVSQLVVSRQDFRAVASQQGPLTAWGLLEEMEAERPAGKGHERPPLATPYVAPASEVERVIADGLRDLLGIERVGVHDNFFDLGGHSLLAVQLVNRLRSRFQVDLPLSSAFEAPTPSGLASAVTALQLAGSEDAGAIAELLREIEGLSEEELRRAIAEEAAGGEREHG